MKFESQSPEIQRRTAFLLQEAQHKQPRDLAITYIMRVISNHATVGRDGQSGVVKQQNRNLSRKAYELLLRSKSFDAWHRRTTNEHRRPLKETWNWLVENASNLTAADIWDHFVQNPYITVLTSEDDALRSSKTTPNGPQHDRYAAAKIEVVRLEETPISILRGRTKRR